MDPAHLGPAARTLADLRANLAREDTASSKDDSASLSRRVAQLEAELGSARRSITAANGRAETLEKKITMLTTLHRDSEARHAGKLAEAGRYEREARELRV